MREYLKKRRKELSLTQSGVASLMGISRNYYNYIEAGKRQVKMEYQMMEKIAYALEMPVQTVIENEREHHENSNGRRYYQCDR